jgi:signal peptidase II
MQERGAGAAPLTHEPDASARPAPAAGRARWGVLLGVAAFVLVVDQLTKWWAMESLPGRTIDLIGSLRLRLAMNYGTAFSVAEGRGALISLLALVIVAVLLVSGREATKPLTAVALGMVVGGAVGNLLDRGFREGEGLLGGGVVDFIDLQWWPIFNLADSAIVVGAILLFLTQLRDGGDEAVGEERPQAGTGTGPGDGETSPSRP